LSAAGAVRGLFKAAFQFLPPGLFRPRTLFDSRDLLVNRAHCRLMFPPSPFKDRPRVSCRSLSPHSFLSFRGFLLALLLFAPGTFFLVGNCRRTGGLLVDLARRCFTLPVIRLRSLLRPVQIEIGRQFGVFAKRVIRTDRTFKNSAGLFQCRSDGLRIIGLAPS
jgi:hypothetical protein